MMGLLKAEWHKTRHGVIRWLVFLLPLLIGAVLAAYIAGRPWIAPSAAFSGFFAVWDVLVLPLGLAILAGALVHEEAAFGMGGMLFCAKPRTFIYLTKLVVLLAGTAVASFLAVTAFSLGLALGGYESGGVLRYAFVAAISWLSAIPLAALTLWTAFAFGMGASVGLGMAGMLVAAMIGATILGDEIWPFLPWAWPFRLAAAAALMLPEALDAAMYAGFLSQIHLACALAVTSGTLFIVAGCVWFSRWDVKPTHE